VADNALMRYSAPDGMFPPNALTPRQPELRAYDEPWYRAVPNALSEWMGLGPSGREIMRNALGPSNPLNIPAQAQEAGHEIGGGLATGDYARAGMGGLGLAMAIGLGPRFFPRGVRAPAETPNVVPQGIRAYHGSPHDFDKFDISKIGTGEGAQAFGHGLYFAENEGVARSYRDTLGGKAIPPPKMFGNQTDADLMARAENAVALANYDKGHAAQRLRSEANYFKNQGDADSATKLGALADRIETGDLTFKPHGRMYEVNINARPEDFLDWDKPLSQQSEKVRKTIEPALKKAAADMGKGASPEKIAQLESMGLKSVADRMRPKEIDPWSLDVAHLATEYPNALREAGIPGIRYKDAMSRGAEGGTSNYVVFDDKLVSILRKYGLLPPAAAGAAAMTSQPNQEQ